MVYYQSSMSEQAALIRALLATEMERLREAMRPVELSDGDILFHRGDPGDAFYIVQSGQVRIFTCDEAGREITLARLGPGEAFGELALLDDNPRSASVSAIGPVTLLRLSRDDFRARVHASPALTQALLQLLSERARSLTEYIEQLGQWARMVAEGKYKQVMQSIQQVQESGDRTLAAVAESVKSMVRAIQEREDKLRQEAARLRIQIDEDRRRCQVESITSSSYFQQLSQQARDLRKQ